MRHHDIVDGWDLMRGYLGAAPQEGHSGLEQRIEIKLVAGDQGAVRMTQAGRAQAGLRDLICFITQGVCTTSLRGKSGRGRTNIGECD